ncbi:MAG TPA: GH32 C-terminal domain-containing protein [Verrucomicrobiae bacterium]|jgi:fructan beta-fructosidase|nr:GH32 C-terminal domain-containing protein [Verrucomicrobiae bacterium]
MRASSFSAVLVFAGLALGPSFDLHAQDILLSNFEQPTYAWLPGNSWAVDGEAFGTAPAQGTLPNQSPVTGYLGHGLADSYTSGDDSLGTLTSPQFTIQRKYIRFLMGGGNYRGQTCMNLLINGQVVRSAVGMGDREDLDYLQWNVSAFLNQTGMLQIVDAAVGPWAHINVDQITETDNALPNVLVASQHYLNLPVQTGAPSHLVELIQNGLVVREFNIELADTATNFYAFMDLTPLQGQELLVRVDSQPASAGQLATYFVQGSNILTDVPIYQEALRPVFHYTARRGWLNDPNGMVYDNGEYHLSYQHNPYGWDWDNMHWGHAVSRDLVHWTELPEALYPDYLGAAWSGSSVIDWSNSAGFGPNAMLDFYTEAAGHANNPRMSAPYRFTQGLAYSLDHGRTFTKYSGNPIVPNVAGDNRDPKVIWYAPGQKWVMVFWLINNDYGFFSSTDLKHWTQTSTFTFPHIIEVPELFQLPLDGNVSNQPWIFYAGAGNYYVGQFDGNTFSSQYGPFAIRGGNSFAAAQTFNNMPASDGRRILIANGTQTYPDMPFNEAMDFPVELTLKTTAGIPQIYVNPVREISLLRTSTNVWSGRSMPNNVNLLAGVSGEAFEIDAYFNPGAADHVTFSLRGTDVVYDNIGHQIECDGLSHTLNPINGVVHLRMLVDRGTLEIYANDGLVYMPMSVDPVAGPQPVSLTASGNGAQLMSLNLYNLGSAWPAAAPFISSQPASATIHAGGPGALSVTASSATVPIFYQWRLNGAPIAGATNSSLSLFPGPASNSIYDVIVSNSAGAVTSQVSAVTVIPPYIVANWRMEKAAVVPNSAGSPAFNGILDAATNSGQGIVAVGLVVPAAEDDLITFNGLPGGPVTLSPSVPPASMFVNRHSGGNFSYNAEAISNVDGALFFPQDQYGDEMDFTGPFCVELFFKTDGNQQNAGPMQLLAQGSDNGQTFRYGVDLNEPVPGAVRFNLAAATNDLVGANYADGKWHYLLAACDTTAGPAGQLRLTVVNEDGAEADATNNLAPGVLPLPAGNSGNLFLGRYSYPLAQTPRTFLGLIDEVQITSGLAADAWRLGRIPSLDNHPRISAAAVSPAGVSLQWTGAAATNFLVQFVPALGGVWQTIATLTNANFIDTNISRLAGAEGYYRVLSQ